MALPPTNTAPGFDLGLLANFVHQVVNPLNGVAGTLDNLTDGTVKEESRKLQRLRAARAQIEQCITLLRNLAFVANSPNIDRSDRRITVLPQVIIEAAMFFQEEGRSREIEFNLVEKHEPNSIVAHPELLRQALMNIFDNCVKYGMPKCTVEIHQRIQKNSGDAIIEIRTKSKIPIDQQDLPRLGELGFRGANAKKIVASGSRLGLHICRKIIEAHDGALEITSQRNGELHFLIRIPRK